MAVVNVVNPEKQDEVYDYFLDENLKRYLDNHVKRDLEQADKDYVMLVDGYEGSGKSTFAFQLARYIDPTFKLERIAMTASEFKQSIINAPKNAAVVYDEAEGLSGGQSITRLGKLLKSLMMQMRQKNLFVIVIMPIIFEFNKYAVLSRARAFFHIYEVKDIRGYWVGYNKKDLRNLYLQGKVSYSYYVRSFFKGRFYGKMPIDKESYLKKKAEALDKLDIDEEPRDNIQRDMVIYALYKQMQSIDKITEELNGLGLKISRSTVATAVRRGKEPKSAGLGV